MKLLASGRDCDVFEAGPGLVLRRAKDGRSLEHEAQVMTWVRDRGYPAPAIEQAEGPDLVMERVDGPTMLDLLPRRLWSMPRYAGLLAELHRRLHALPAPEWLPGDGPSLLHRDFHPDNVILSPAGPVVIDWTNAARGHPAADVAQSWIVMATSEIDGPAPVRTMVRTFQGLFVGQYLRHFDRRDVVAYLPAVAERRKLDRNVRPGERVRIDRLVARAGPNPGH